MHYMEKVLFYNNCFDFVDVAIARICRPALNERMVYGNHIRKSEDMTVLWFMNRVY